ncbi:hypothetical protein JCM11491_001013 [Sporobolomyces phaffii]
MVEPLYSSVPSTEPAAATTGGSRPVPLLLERWNSLSSWTNPFLSRFGSLSSTAFSSVRRGLSSSSAASASTTLRSRTPTIVSSAQPDSVKYNSVKKEGDEDEATVGLVSGVPEDSTQTTTTRTTQPKTHGSIDPFDDAHAVTPRPKPLWHRAIVAGTILAGLVGVGLGLGLGIKKITHKVGEIEAARLEASIAATRTSSSTASSTASSSSASSSFSSSPSTSSSSTSISSPLTSTSTVSTSLTSTFPRTTSLPTTVPVAANDDVLWAVPKTR